MFQYAVESQIRLKGFDPETSMVCLKPREGEFTLRPEDILSYLEREGDSVAVVLLPGVQYYTGQLFDMKTITEVAQRKVRVKTCRRALSVSLFQWYTAF